jgi:hypothetical protein
MMMIQSDRTYNRWEVPPEPQRTGTNPAAHPQIKNKYSFFEPGTRADVDSRVTVYSLKDLVTVRMHRVWLAARSHFSAVFFW